MTKRIDRVDVRAKLPIQRNPHWARLSEGRYLGFRRMNRGTPGTWIARAYLSDQKYKFESLGDFVETPEGERYDKAKQAAEKWFQHQHLDLGGSTEPQSVKAACEAYVEKLRLDRSERAAKDVEGFFRRLVYSDPIAKVQLSKLTKPHMSAWRTRLLERNEDHSSFNRNVTPLRAALNLAHEEGKASTDQAWLKALKPFKSAGKRRELYLDRVKRGKLVEKMSDEARPFFRTLNMMPMRPGEVAVLRVEHLKAQQRALEIPTGKTKSRAIPLTGEALAHFKACAKGKLPSAWLVSRADGSQWKKEAWRDEIKDAARKAKLPRATVAYSLRHSVITDLIKGDADRGVPPLDIFTCAAIAGTSVVMLEKHYGHLQQEHARAALEKLALA